MATTKAKASPRRTSAVLSAWECALVLVNPPSLRTLLCAIILAGWSGIASARSLHSFKIGITVIFFPSRAERLFVERVGGVQVLHPPTANPYHPSPSYNMPLTPPMRWMEGWWVCRWNGTWSSRTQVANPCWLRIFLTLAHTISPNTPGRGVESARGEGVGAIRLATE